MFPRRVIAGMICFTAFFGIAIGLGAWLPNIMNAKGFSITKSLQYTLAMNFAVPCASIFMMYALDKFGRKITAICAFVAAGVMAIVFANAGTADRADVAGFIMVFFVQVAGNSMQIFTSEVFPTNARASGFGWASGVGRLATAFIMPTILWVQNGWGLTTVFACLADAAVHRRSCGDAARPRSAAEEPRRDRAADRMTSYRLAGNSRPLFRRSRAGCGANVRSAELAHLSERPLRHDDRLSRIYSRPNRRRTTTTGGASRAPTARNSRSLLPTMRSISTSPDFRNTSWRNLDPGKAVTYQAHGEDWFVISGTKGDGIFYERYMLSHGKEMAVRVL